MTNPLKPSAQKVQDALLAQGFTNTVIELSDSTRTSVEAAAAVGCAVAQIAKSLIFQSKESQRAILVIASGVNRVNEKRIMERLGEKLQKPDADFVREQTGFVIGGVAPVAHMFAPIVLMDEDLLAYERVWPAAGHPNTMFHISPPQLAAITHARVADVALVKKDSAT